jgi:hypothetical protein
MIQQQLLLRAGEEQAERGIRTHFCFTSQTEGLFFLSYLLQQHPAKQSISAAVMSQGTGRC